MKSYLKIAQENWDKFYLGMAEYVSTKSKDPSTKCGAVIVRPDHTVCSLGFNGFPRCIKDDERLGNREQKYSLIIHAEMNAILNSRESVKGYSLYTYPLCPCDRCAVHIIQAGVCCVVCPEKTKVNSILKEKSVCVRWEEAVNKSKKYFEEAGITLIEY